jgi:hypothetical protein
LHLLGGCSNTWATPPALSPLSLIVRFLILHRPVPTSDSSPRRHCHEVWTKPASQGLGLGLAVVCFSPAPTKGRAQRRCLLEIWMYVWMTFCLTPLPKHKDKEK